MDQISSYTLRTYTAGVSSLFSNQLSNDFRLNYSSNATTRSTVIDAFGGGTPVNLGQLTGLGSDSWVFLILIYGGQAIFLSQPDSSGAQRQWNLVDAVSASLGRHQLKLGGDYRRLSPFASQPVSYAPYVFIGTAAITANSASITPGANSPAYPLYTNFSAFAQDQWKVSQRLGLSFGLRWEVNPPPSVTKGLKPYTIDFVSSDPNTWRLAPQGTPLWRTTWFNFAPRFGVAYLLNDARGWETVVRGGSGVFFDTGQQLGSAGFLGPGFQTLGTTQQISFPCSPTPCSAATLIPPIVNPPVPPFVSVVYGFAPHLQLPYTLQWNASFEQELGDSQAITASYVGSHAARLLQQNQFLLTSNPNGQNFDDFIETKHHTTSTRGTCCFAAS
jgi:hypothetical protein